MITTVVCGMPNEVSIAREHFTNCQIIQYNHSPTFDLDAEVDPKCTKIASFGFNGGLAPGFAVGDVCFVANMRTEANLTQEFYIPGITWTSNIANMFKWPKSNLKAKMAKWFSNGQENLANSVEQRKSLWTASGAEVIDDESYYVLQVSLKRKIPWTIVRVISDDWKMNLPPAATGLVMNPDGSANTAYVMQQIEKDPWQVPALVQLALDMGYAQSILSNVANVLGPTFGV